MGFVGPESKHGTAFRHGIDCHIKPSGFCTTHWVHHHNSPIWTKVDPVFTVEVGFSTGRPVIVDERMSTVKVTAKTAVEATQIAAQIVACHSAMVTSTDIIDWT